MSRVSRLRSSKCTTSSCRRASPFSAGSGVTLQLHRHGAPAGVRDPLLQPEGRHLARWPPGAGGRRTRRRSSSSTSVPSAVPSSWSRRVAGEAGEREVRPNDAAVLPDQRAGVRKGAEERAEADLGDPAGVVVGAPLGDRPGHGGDLAQAAACRRPGGSRDLDAGRTRPHLLRRRARKVVSASAARARSSRARSSGWIRSAPGRPTSSSGLVPEQPATCRRRRRGTRPARHTGRSAHAVLAHELPLGLMPRPARHGQPEAPRRSGPAPCSSGSRGARLGELRAERGVPSRACAELTRDVAAARPAPGSARHSCVLRASRSVSRTPRSGHGATLRSRRRRPVELVGARSVRARVSRR